jgi:O-acetyl-ADP-ribose deacetylase (regulator of RNase III)
VSGPAAIPDVDDLITDLRLLRERGLIRLRHSDLPALRRAAAASSVSAAAAGGPAAVEALLHAAVENLAGGDLGAAASHTFGLGRGGRGQTAQARRQLAARDFNVSVERFRKYQERIVVEQVAEEILKLCQPPEDRAAPPPELGQRTRLTGRAGQAEFTVTVHTEPVELLTGVDIVVAPQNLYLALPQHFKSSFSAAIRRAAAIRGQDGEIVTDVIDVEIRAWLEKNGRPGLPIAAGTVVPTSPGAMAGHGVRRIYHAAVTSPRPGRNDYDVEPTVIAQAAQGVLALARAERDDFDPPLRSVGFPLLGAGRGGLDPTTSLTWLWTAIERDFAVAGPWDLHLLARRRPVSDLIVSALIGAGLAVAQVPADPDPEPG